MTETKKTKNIRIGQLKRRLLEKKEQLKVLVEAVRRGTPPRFPREA